jgi:hypothetical protein
VLLVEDGNGDNQGVQRVQGPPRRDALSQSHQALGLTKL